ncbi:hypothetical protein TNCV_1730391 [Trichonephila clavipes]|nr:hypothetical protein TNCV_1730391 [Trichonephila clavipes]
MLAFASHRRLREGMESVKDDKRSGHPQTLRTAENIKKFSAALPVDKDHSLLGRIVTRDEKGRFFTTRNPKEHRQHGNHHNIPSSTNSIEISQKGRAC